MLNKNCLNYEKCLVGSNYSHLSDGIYMFIYGFRYETVSKNLGFQLKNTLIQSNIKNEQFQSNYHQYFSEWTLKWSEILEKYPKNSVRMALLTRFYNTIIRDFWRFFWLFYPMFHMKHFVVKLWKMIHRQVISKRSNRTSCGKIRKFVIVKIKVWLKHGKIDFSKKNWWYLLINNYIDVRFLR